MATKEKKKIPNSIIPETYRVANDVFSKRISNSEGVKILISDDRINKNSASDFIYNFRCLMKGIKFTRTFSAFAMDYYLRNISKDYGKSKLTIALEALHNHIKYYEELQGVTMHQMRKLHSEFLKQAAENILVTELDHLIENIRTVESYLIDDDESVRAKVSNIIKNGICFVAYRIDEEVRFAPSKFLGYVKNTIERYVPPEMDGRDTNVSISEIIGTKPIANVRFERLFKDFCFSLGIRLNENPLMGIQRKYWTIELKDNFSESIDYPEEFPEGRLVERIHKFRERNKKVIDLAKKMFIAEHGRLFCQICQFDFKFKYGDLGTNFIEGHHTIAVKDMEPGHVTKPEDIAMLCANCHRMVHKKRPWLSMTDLMKLIEKT